MIVGYDISSLLEVEAGGGVFSDGGMVRPLERILAAHGATHARLRLWVDPVPPHCSLADVRLMARRIHAAGLKLILDFHYCDFWADPGKQPTPARWREQEVEALADSVYDYTRSVMGALAEAGTPADTVQIGNEITNGMLWPQGELYGDNYGDNKERWDEFTHLLRAGIAGVQDTVAADGTPSIVLHIDRGGDNAGSRTFMDRVLQRGIEFDVLGLSYYPWWHGPVSALRDNLCDLAERYEQPIVIMETAYPWTLENHGEGSNMVTRDTLLPAGFPPTVEGQRSFLQHLWSLLEQLPHGRGAGLVYWEPAWLPGISLEPDSGNPWDNLTLFGPHGDALPSLQWVDTQP